MQPARRPLATVEGEIEMRRPPRTKGTLKVRPPMGVPNGKAVNRGEMKRGKARTEKHSTGTKKDAERLQFIEWLAIPSWERKPKAQAQFAGVIRVDPVTLSIWKGDPLLMAEVQKRATEHMRKYRPDVLEAIARAAIEGNHLATTRSCSES